MKWEVYKKSFTIKKKRQHHEQSVVYCKQRHLKMIAVSEFLKHRSFYENKDPHCSGKGFNSFIYSYTYSCDIFKVLSTQMIYKDFVLQFWNFPFDELEQSD